MFLGSLVEPMDPKEGVFVVLWVENDLAVVDF